MLNKEGFNKWSRTYDKSVTDSKESDTYPFAGYDEVIDSVYKEVITKTEGNVLDLGFGTAVLTSRLYDKGLHIFGQDFSEEMIKAAKAKMPDAELYAGDFSKSLCNELKDKSYDYIISTYAMHHILDCNKPAFIKEIFNLLKEGGSILIGDVAFETREEMEKCREENEGCWDESEHYFVYDEIVIDLPGRVSFEKKSHCAGIIKVSK